MFLSIRDRFCCSNQGFNQGFDEYFDASSYPFQEERYGQDEEDRQWDSGGYYKRNSSSAKKLPTVPVVQNYLNKKRSSLIAQEVYQSCDGYLSSSTPKTRRRMPQIPNKRSASRQSSINDETYDGYYTPENTSHRGASLPPTPTKTPKVLARIAANAKPFNSLPPTPGRKLPQPNFNHRSAKARRNNLMKRTSSAEYGDYPNGDVYDNCYVRPGAISAREVYNEDALLYYNDAYQSIDNLSNQQEELNLALVGNSDYRTSVTTVVSQNGTSLPFQQSTEEYYISAQEELEFAEPDYYDQKQKESVQKKKLRARGSSPLVQQNTDSLESRDDELKDSFETAVSSVSSSLHQQRRVPYFDGYSATVEPVTNTSTAVVSQASVDSSLKTSSVSNVQYRRDQSEPVKAIATLNSTNASVPDVTITEPTNNTVNQTLPFKNANSRGYLVQQESVDSNYLQHQESLDDDSFIQAELANIGFPEKIKEEPYLEQQESIESYVEEDINDISADYTKAINRESPASVIHVTQDDASLRRGSSQITVVDPFHPSLQQRPLEPYAPISTRRASIDPYRPASPVKCTAEDAYQSPSSLKPVEDLYVTQRKSSIDPYQQVAPPRRASVRHSPSPLEYEENEEDEQIVLEEELPETKHLEEEDEEIEPARPKVTAQQRWLWAYNKIIMQLNVSREFFCHLLQ